MAGYFNLPLIPPSANTGDELVVMGNIWNDGDDERLFSVYAEWTVGGVKYSSASAWVHVPSWTLRFFELPLVMPSGTIAVTLYLFEATLGGLQLGVVAEYGPQTIVWQPEPLRAGIVDLTYPLEVDAGAQVPFVVQVRNAGGEFGALQVRLYIYPYGAKRVIVGSTLYIEPGATSTWFMWASMPWNDLGFEVVAGRMSADLKTWYETDRRGPYIIGSRVPAELVTEAELAVVVDDVEAALRIQAEELRLQGYTDAEIRSALDFWIATYPEVQEVHTESWWSQVWDFTRGALTPWAGGVEWSFGGVVDWLGILDTRSRNSEDAIIGLPASIFGLLPFSTTITDLWDAINSIPRYTIDFLEEAGAFFSNPAEWILDRIERWLMEPVD